MLRFGWPTHAGFSADGERFVVVNTGSPRIVR
jgi:hypothetical protein